MADPFNPAPGSDVGPASRARLNIVRLDAYIGHDGSPMLRLHSGGGSSACCAHGVPLALLTSACDTFNAVIAGEPCHDTDPGTLRRRRGLAAQALGDRVRDLVLESGL